MQYRALVVASAFVIGCVPPVHDPHRPYVEQVLAANPPSTDPIAPPPTLVAHPLKVGTWALYKRDDGFDRITVVAEDTVGTWVAFETQTSAERSQWLLCVRVTAPDPLQAAIELREGGPPTLVDFRKPHPRERAALAYYLTRLTPANWPTLAYPATEDVDVPAGHFIQALRSDQADGTWWAHPAVPFDGLIRSHRATGSDYVLLAYGTDAPWSVVESFAVQIASAMEPMPRSNVFLGIGAGVGSLSGHGHEASSSATEVDFFYGYRVGRHVDLIAKTSRLGNLDYAPDPALRQDLLQTSLGARWKAAYAPAELYLQADVGYAELRRSARIDDASTDVTAHGIAAGGAIGALLQRGRDWSLAVEVSDRVLVLDSGAGTRNVLGGFLAVQLYLPRWRF